MNILVVVDITAGNRHIWGGWMPEYQDPGPVIYSDKEPFLKMRPDIVADLRYLPIRDQVVHEVIADPPYWNFGTSIHGDPMESKGSFWGNFHNLTYLRSLLVGILKNSRRVLRPGGRLYLKWCDVVYPWRRFSAFFTRDFILEHTETRESKSGRGKKPCYWLTYRLKGVSHG